MLGRRITKRLLNLGDEVAWLTRSSDKKKAKIKAFFWDTEDGIIDPEAILWATHIINLAGESIGETHWTKEGKAKILNSRVNSVRTLVTALQQRMVPLDGFVGVSGIGIYGPGYQPNSEKSQLGNDFPALVAKEWEDCYDAIDSTMTKSKSILRLGVVLSTKEGALPKIMMPIKMGLGAPLGTGRQPFSWIHIDDATESFIEALDWNGIYNVTAPEAIPNKEMTKFIANALHTTAFLPNVPTFVLKWIFGERCILVTEGNVVDISKLKETGFQFQYPTFKKAIANLVSRDI